VVLIGTTICSNDEKNLPPLPQVQQNIHYLSRLFTDPDIVGLPPDAVVPILDYEEASAVLTAIARAAEEATDTLIVYYAGHGLYGDSNIPLYLATKNTTSATRSFSGVRITDVKSAMRGSRATKRVLILDCCYSGRAFQEGDMAAVADAVRPAVDLIGTYGIAAVPSDSKALAPPGAPLTKFTQVLVDVLERGIEKSGQVLTLGEVFVAVKADIGRNAEMPLPEAINWNEGKQFRLARNRYLKRSGLDEIIKGLEGLRQTVTLTGARVEAIEVKSAAIEQFAGRLSELENRISTGDFGAGRTSADSAPTMLWERVGLSLDQWNRLPVVPFKEKIEYYAEEIRNKYVILLSIAVLASMTVIFMIFGVSLVWQNAAGHLLLMFMNISYYILIFITTLLLFSFCVDFTLSLLSRPPSQAPPLDDDISVELLYNEKLNRMLSRDSLRWFGLSFSRRSLMFCVFAGIFAVGVISLIGLAMGDYVGFRILFTVPQAHITDIQEKPAKP
jgi:hypothetical protein